LNSSELMKRRRRSDNYLTPLGVSLPRGTQMATGNFYDYKKLINHDGQLHFNHMRKDVIGKKPILKKKAFEKTESLPSLLPSTKLGSSTSLMTRIISTQLVSPEIPPSLIPIHTLEELNNAGGLCAMTSGVATPESFSGGMVGKLETGMIALWLSSMHGKLTRANFDTEDKIEDSHRIHFVAFHELCRQVMGGNFQRGSMLLDLWKGSEDINESRLEIQRMATDKSEERCLQLERKLEEQVLVIASLRRGNQHIGDDSQEPRHVASRNSLKESSQYSFKRQPPEEGRRKTRSSRRTSILGENALAKIESRQARTSTMKVDLSSLFEMHIAEDDDEEHHNAFLYSLDNSDEEELRARLLKEDLDFASQQILVLQEQNDFMKKQLESLREELESGYEEKEESLLQAACIAEELLVEKVSIETQTESSLLDTLLDSMLETHESKRNEADSKLLDDEELYAPKEKLSEIDSLLNLKLTLKKPKGIMVRDLKWLLKHIAFINNERVASTTTSPDQPHAVFVFESYLRKYGLPSVAKKHMQSLVLTTAKNQLDLSASLFYRFLQGELDSELLNFYLRAMVKCRTRNINDSQSSFKNMKSEFNLTTEKIVLFPESEDGKNWVATNRLEEIILSLFPVSPIGMAQRVIETCSIYETSGLLKEWDEVAPHIRSLLGKTARVNRDMFLHVLLLEKMEIREAQQMFFRELFVKGDDNGDGVLEYGEFTAVVLGLYQKFDEHQIMQMFRSALAHPSNKGEDSITPNAFADVCVSKGLDKYLQFNEDGTTMRFTLDLV